MTTTDMLLKCYKYSANFLLADYLNKVQPLIKLYLSEENKLN